MNTARLRIWVNPEEGIYGLEYNIELAKRMVKKGFRVYLDFHFALVQKPFLN
jgi:arabinogalactan endo-1,4-beta-galactosidase